MVLLLHWTPSFLVISLAAILAFQQRWSWLVVDPLKVWDACFNHFARATTLQVDSNSIFESVKISGAKPVNAFQWRFSDSADHCETSSWISGSQGPRVSFFSGRSLPQHLEKRNQELLAPQLQGVNIHWRRHAFTLRRLYMILFWNFECQGGLGQCCRWGWILCVVKQFKFTNTDSLEEVLTSMNSFHILRKPMKCLKLIGFANNGDERSIMKHLRWLVLCFPKLSQPFARAQNTNFRGLSLCRPVSLSLRRMRLVAMISRPAWNSNQPQPHGPHCSIFTKSFVTCDSMSSFGGLAERIALEAGQSRPGRSLESFCGTLVVTWTCSFDRSIVLELKRRS